MMKLRYSPAGEEDVELLYALSKDLIDTYEDLASIDYDRVLAWVKRKITKHITSYTCIFNRDEKVGYYRLSQVSGGTELDDLYILPEYRNRGIGSEILEKIVQETEKPLFLYVFTGNTSAIRLYQRFGFRQMEQVSPTRIIMAVNG